MNYKSKTAIILLSLITLSAYGSSDNKEQPSSNDTLTTSKIDPATKSEESENNLLINGDFENWTGTTPSAWTTIDKRISIAKNTETYHSGLSAAEISVNTTSQGNTDFRQSVDVVAGKKYTFSTWIYHTEGTVKARLYTGGYQDYSNPDLVNEWQKVTATYAAKDNLSIEVGLRFYDLPGFKNSEIVYIDNVTFTESSDTATTQAPPTTPAKPTTPVDTTAYYKDAVGKTKFELKTALYNIVKGHTVKSYSDLWSFMSANSLDKYYEKDNSILDMYSENPSASDSYNYKPGSSKAGGNQCGNYSGEGGCYNREHSFPKSWFAKKSPMVSDVHHIFATDGKVNSSRSNFPYGEVGRASFISKNGSKLGSAKDGLGYLGTVFEPIDEFKGDFARAHFYMATRYQNIISTWEKITINSDAVLDGSSDNVFEPWVIVMLKHWNEIDPVSQKERDRNEAAYKYQGNRNPFIDHPEYVNEIWTN